MSWRFLVVIPPCNEAESIERLVSEARRHADVCVVDDGSTDATSEILARADVVSDSARLRDRYGFTSRHSIATFEELLRYVSAACGSLTRELVGALQETARAPARQDWDAIARVDLAEHRPLDEDPRRCRSDLAGRAWGSDADQRLRAPTPGARGMGEGRAGRAGGRLLTATAKVLSPWAWLVKSSE